MAKNEASPKFYKCFFCKKMMSREALTEWYTVLTGKWNLVHKKCRLKRLKESGFGSPENDRSPS